MNGFSNVLYGQGCLSSNGDEQDGLEKQPLRWVRLRYEQVYRTWESRDTIHAGKESPAGKGFRT